MKILLAVDGSEYSEAAAAEVAEQIGLKGSQVKIVTAIRLPFVPTEETRSLPESEYSQLEQQKRQEAESVLQRTATYFERCENAQLSTEILLGEAAEVILEEAERWHADMIAIGSNGYRGWKRFLLGSVSQEIAKNAECSVMILRPRKMQFTAAE